MNEISVPLALLDFVPVGICAVVLSKFLKDFYSRMTPLHYAFFSAGSFMLVSGSFLKALQKILFALEVCDFTVLTEQFFPCQALAFIFLSIGTYGMLRKNKNITKLCSVSSIPVITSHLPFIILMTLGLISWYIGLIAVSAKLKCKKGIICMIIALVIMLAKSGLGTKFDNSQGIMHWFAESINTIAHIFFLVGAFAMHKAMSYENADKS